VTWINRDRAPHTVTSGVVPTPDGLWDSGALPIEVGGFTHVFNEPGEFPYWCQIHPFMVGTVTVTP
jgi:plastocyanin